MALSTPWGRVPEVGVSARGPFAVGSVLWRDARGKLVCTVVAKATYDLVQGEAAPSDMPLPLQEEDVHWDDDASRSVHLPSDLAPFKAAAEVVVVGSAFAPGERAARSVVARVVVASVDKAVECFPPRRFRLDGSVDDATPLVRFSLRYEHAAGGPDNPPGIDVSRADVRGRRPIPALLPPSFPLGLPGDHIPPAGLGPIAAAWPQRLAGLGPHDHAWMRHPAATPLPPTLSGRHYQVAPPDQWLDRALVPNERVVLENLHAKHPRLVMSLSGIEPRALVAGAREPLRLAADLLLVDADRALCTLTFRGQIAVDDRASHVRLVVVGVPMGGELGDEAARQILEEAGAAVAPALLAGEPDDVAATQMPARWSVGRPALPFSRATGAPAPRPSVPDGALPFRGPADADPRPVPAEPRFSAPPAAHAAERPRTEPPPSPPHPTAPLLMAPLSAPPPVAPPVGPPPVAPPVGPPPVAPPVGPPPVAPSVVPPPVMPPAVVPLAVVPPPVVAPPPAVPSFAAPEPPPVVAPPLVRAEPLLSLGASLAGAPAPTLGTTLAGASAPAPSLGATLAGAPAPAPAKAAPAPEPPPPAKPASFDGAFGKGPAKPAAKPGGFGSAFGSAKNLSDAAADRPQATPAAAKEPDKPAEPRRLWVLDLLHHDPRIAGRLRGTRRWGLVWPAKERPRAPSAVDEARAEVPAAERERADVLRVLSYGQPESAAAARRALDDALDDPVDHDPPLVLVTGELRPTFDELETLRATVAIAQPLAGNDKKLLASIAVAQEALAGSLPPRPDATLGLARQIEQNSLALSLPPRYVGGEVERVLLEGRKYKRRPLLGAPRVRADLAVAGGGSNDVLTVYLPDTMAASLPLLPAFPVVALFEVRPREDVLEPAEEAFFAVAVGRVLRARERG